MAEILLLTEVTLTEAERSKAGLRDTDWERPVGPGMPAPGPGRLYSPIPEP
jgi:hypothetical protein